MKILCCIHHKSNPRAEGKPLTRDKKCIRADAHTCTRGTVNKTDGYPFAHNKLTNKSHSHTMSFKNEHPHSPPGDQNSTMVHHHKLANKSHSCTVSSANEHPDSPLEDQNLTTVHVTHRNSYNDGEPNKLKGHKI